MYVVMQCIFSQQKPITRFHASHGKCRILVKRIYDHLPPRLVLHFDIHLKISLTKRYSSSFAGPLVLVRECRNPNNNQDDVDVLLPWIAFLTEEDSEKKDREGFAGLAYYLERKKILVVVLVDYYVSARVR